MPFVHSCYKYIDPMLRFLQPLQSTVCLVLHLMQLNAADLLICCLACLATCTY